jgi:hypothetical protein
MSIFRVLDVLVMLPLILSAQKLWFCGLRNSSKVRISSLSDIQGGLSNVTSASDINADVEIHKSAQSDRGSSPSESFSEFVDLP